MILSLNGLSLKDRKTAGGKGSALGELMKAGFPVPAGFVIPVKTKLASKEISEAVWVLGAKKLAVRSSAMIEDGTKYSYAGKFTTVLDVLPKNVMAAIKKVRASGPHMAVIVQEMIDGDTSGVAFSVHPVTGNRNQIVIETVRGTGEKLVSGRATPTTMILDKKSAKHALAKTVLNIEKHFGYPVDVEWTRKGKRLYILQSRPITTL